MQLVDTRANVEPAVALVARDALLIGVVEVVGVLGVEPGQHLDQGGGVSRDALAGAVVELAAHVVVGLAAALVGAGHGQPVEPAPARFGRRQIVQTERRAVGGRHGQKVVQGRGPIELLDEARRDAQAEAVELFQRGAQRVRAHPGEPGGHVQLQAAGPLDAVHGQQGQRGAGDVAVPALTVGEAGGGNFSGVDGHDV